jgi:mercuric ion transport protein
MKAQGAALAGSVLSSVLASACCLGPVVLTLIGLSGGALAHRFEPLRPYMLATTYTLLGGAFFLTYRQKPQTCGPDGTCATPGPSRLAKVLLWLATVVVVLVTTFPSYSQYLF